MSTSNLETVYNELSHTANSSNDVNGLDPMYHWDAHYPERLSLNTEFPSPVARRSRKGRNRNSARFKTQPITFDEIKEVDEEASTTTEDAKQKIKEGLKSQFSAFSRSMDGLVPHYRKGQTNVRPLSSDYNENQIPCRKTLVADQPPSSRLSPEVPSPPSEEAKTTTTTDSDSATPFPLPQLSDSARNRRQKRFKKKQRHSRSIEEEIPEVVPGKGDPEEASR